MLQFFRSHLMVAVCLLTCSSCAHLETNELSSSPGTAKVRRPPSRLMPSDQRQGDLKPVGWENRPRLFTAEREDAKKGKAAPIPAPAPPATAKEPTNQDQIDGDDEKAKQQITSVLEEIAVGEGVTLTKLEQLALQNNPTLRQAGFLVQQTEGNWLQVGLYPNPVMGYQGEEINDDGTAGKQGIFINQTIVTGDKLDWNRTVASWDVEQARWQVDAQRWAVVNSVRTQFYAVLAAQRTIEVAEELLKIVQQGVEAAEELNKAGQVPETDVLQAKLERNAVQIILRSARRQEAGARRELASLLGISELPPGPLAGRLDHEMPTVNYELEWQKVASNSPALHFAQAQVEQARAQVQREMVQPIPDVLVQANALNDYAQNRGVYGVQLGVALPILNRNQGNISAAQSALHQAVENVHRLEWTLRQQLAQAVQRYEVAQTQAELYRDDILPTAQAALDLTTKGYRSGEVNFLRVLTVRRTYVENQVNYIAALQELRSAYVDIEGLLISGGLNNPTQVFGQFGGGRGGSGGGGGSPGPITETPKTNVQ